MLVAHVQIMKNIMAVVGRLAGQYPADYKGGGEE